MKRFLKILVLIIVLVAMLVTLTACSSDDSANVTSSNSLSYIKNKKNSQSTTTTTSSENSLISQIASLSDDEIKANAEKQMAEPEEGETIAIFHIENYGDVTVKFFDEVAPKAVENFVTHAKEGYYDGVTFHRVINEFMIQGGDPLGNGTGGESIWGEGFAEELDASILPYRGALCMASSGTGTSSLGSQFFIVQANYNSSMASYLDSYGIGNLEEAYEEYAGDLVDLVGYAQYTTFGQVIDGMDIVDEIAAVETNSSNKPLTDVIISSIEITTYSK